MMLRSIIKSMQRELRQAIPNLNFGGCIHFAYYFTKALKKAGIDYKVYGFHHSPIGKTYETFGSIAHVTVWIENIGFVDGHETDGHYIDYDYKNHIKLKNLNRLRYEYEWNPSYDLEDNEVLEKIINKYIQ